MDPFKRIQILLRLADLCSPTETERRQGYMDQIDEILNGIETKEIETPLMLLINTLNFDAPAYEWGWHLPSGIFDKIVSRNIPIEDAISLGHLLSSLCRYNPQCIRKRTNKGSKYYLPPFKE